MVLPSRWHRSSCKLDGLPQRSCLVGCPRETGCCSRGVSRTHSQWQADRASSNPSCRSSHGSCSRRKSCSTYQPQSHSQNASEEKPQGPCRLLLTDLAPDVSRAPLTNLNPILKMLQRRNLKVLVDFFQQMNLEELVRVANVFPHRAKLLPSAHPSLVVHPLDALQDDVHLPPDVAHHLVHRPLRLLLEVLLDVEVADYRGEDSTGSANTLLPSGSRACSSRQLLAVILLHLPC